jgi:hypothetical protein
MRSDDTPGGGEIHSTDTPLFDATVQALADNPTGTGTAAEDTTGQLAGDLADPDHDWVDHWYGDPATPTPLLNPDTPEGAAILHLFHRIKEIEHADGRWPAVDVLTEVIEWFASLGIDCTSRPQDAGRRLRLALRDRPGGGPMSAVYGVRIGTDHNDPEPIIRTALHVLARQLGPGTAIDLVAHDRDVLARIEQPYAPTTNR